MPDFLIIGGKKCGTTATFRALRQHPELCLPQKEVHFFSYEGRPPHLPHVVTNLSDYQSLFDGCDPRQLVGEASPSYLHLAEAAGRIQKYLPGVKLIAVLRHPVDRIYSDYLHEVQIGSEHAGDLRTALSEDRAEQRFNYREKSRYAEHLMRYFGLFPQERIHIGLFDDFTRSPGEFVRSILAFLGVDEEFEPEIVRSRATGFPRSRAIHALVSGQHPMKSLIRRVVPRRAYISLGYRLHNRNLARPEMDSRLRADLIEEFREEVEQLSGMIGRDLRHWLR